MEIDSKITAIIVTYNSEKWVDKFAKSLSNEKLISNVIIVDNNSIDDTCLTISNNFKNFNLIELTENVGFAKANNIGIRKALEKGSDYIFLLNHDAWIESETISNLLKSALTNPDYGVISPIHLNGTGDLLDFNFTRYISQVTKDGRLLYTDLIKKNELRDIYNVDFVNAAAWFLSAKCISKVGLFDHEFFPHYNEDGNYLQRVVYHDFKVGICPKSFIYHDREDRQGIRNTFYKDKSRYIGDILFNLLNVQETCFDSRFRQSAKANLSNIFKSMIKLDIQGARFNLHSLYTKLKNRKYLKTRLMDYQKSFWP